MKKFELGRGLGVILRIMLSLVLLFGCTKASDFYIFEPLGTEPEARLVLEVKWGNKPNELEKALDVWTPSFEHYFVRNDEVFIADELKRVVKYYKNGKFIKDYDYSYVKGRFFGLVVINELMYWFIEYGGVLGVSITDGEVKHSGKFDFPTSQNNHYVYIYNNLLLVSEEESNKGTVVKVCLAPDLQETKCPKFLVPEDNQTHWGTYQYMAEDQISFYEILIKDGEPRMPRMVHTDHGMSKIQGVVNINVETDYDAHVQPTVVKDGVYFVEHTEKSAKIWFKSWWM